METGKTGGGILRLFLKYWEYHRHTDALKLPMELRGLEDFGTSLVPIPSRFRLWKLCSFRLRAETCENPGYAVAELNLNERFLTYWLSVGPAFGEGPDLYLAERRPETYRES